MDEIEALLSRTDMPFEEAIDYFKERVPVTPEQFNLIAEKYRSQAFTVGGYSKTRILKQFYNKLLTALEEGSTLSVFRTEMNRFLETEGYKGITAFQADNIFRTNIQTAYNVGHYESMTDKTVMKLRPYWQYDAVNDSHTRPSHLGMDGKVFPADSPVWDTWYPPNGFRCRCTVRSLSKRQVEQRGLTVEEKAPVAGMLPDGQFTGILPDPHFASNPAKARFKPDLSGYPEAIAKAYRTQQKDKTGK